MQREDVLEQALQLLEIKGIADATLEMLAERIKMQPGDLTRFWPDKEALLYDVLRYLSDKVDTWRRQLILNEELTREQKLLARYGALTECVSNNRYPGCLFIAACSFFPETDHPIHQLAEQQKLTSLELTRELLRDMDADDADMVAQQMELIQEGCLSKLLVKRQLQDVSVAKRLAEDILQVAQCRRNGALS